MGSDFDINYNFDFNKIFVLESLGPNEKQTGTELYEDLLLRKSDQLDWFETEYANIVDTKDFGRVIQNILNQTEVGVKPFLHLEIHGSNDQKGLVLKNGDCISWKTLADYIRPINRKVKNNLFVTFAVCYANNIFDELSPNEPAPVYGYIAADRAINISEVRTFLTFFDILFEKMDCAYALTILHRQLGRSQVYSITLSEHMFNRVWREYKKKMSQPEYFQNIVNFYLTTLIESSEFPDEIKLNKSELEKNICKKLKLNLENKEKAKDKYLYRG